MKDPTMIKLEEKKRIENGCNVMASLCFKLILDEIQIGKSQIKLPLKLTQEIAAIVSDKLEKFIKSARAE